MAKKKKKEEEEFIPEEEPGFGWAEAFAAALSGLAGTDFAGMLAEATDATRNRNLRGRELFEDRQFREEQIDYQRERDRQQDIFRAQEAATPLVESLGLDALLPQPTVTGGATPQVGALGVPIPQLKVENKEQPLPTEISDYVRGLGISEEDVSTVAQGARTQAVSRIRLEEQKFERDLKNEETRIMRLAPTLRQIAIEDEIAKFDAMETRNWSEYQKRAYLQHYLSMQQLYASDALARGRDTYKPRDAFEAILIGQAQELRGRPGAAKMSNAQFRSTIYTLGLERARELGATIPDSIEIEQGLNQAVRFYAPGINPLPDDDDNMPILGRLTATADQLERARLTAGGS